MVTSMNTPSFILNNSNLALEIKKLARETPNDMELGRLVRIAITVDETNRIFVANTHFEFDIEAVDSVS